MTNNKYSPEERIFSVILALVSSPFGLTREQLLSSVQGYAAFYKVGEDNASLARKFERDKDQIRSLGIPIEVIDSPGNSGNNQLSRYRIQKTSLQIPENFHFSDEELNLLRSAALAWSETSLSSQSKQALIKLEAQGAKIDYSNLGIAPKVFIKDASAQIIHKAIHDGNSLKFHYQKPNTDLNDLRTVTPFQLHRADTRWHLIAFDHDRQDWRVFLMSRIISKPKPVAKIQLEDSEFNASADVLKVLEQLQELQRSQKAEIRLKNDSMALNRLSSRAKEVIVKNVTTVVLETLDYQALAVELVPYAHDIVSLKPEILENNYRQILQTIIEQHG